MEYGPRIASAVFALSGVLAITAALAGAPPPELRLAGGLFHPLSAAAPTPAWYQEGSAGSLAPTDASASGRRYLVAITVSSLDPDQRSLLEAAGAEVLDYLPVHGYRLRLTPGAEERVRELAFVAWLGELPAHFKVQPQLARLAPAAGATVAGAAVRVRVILFTGEPENRVVTALAGLVDHAAPAGKDGAWRVTASVPSSQLGAMLSRLVDLPEVEAIEQVHPFRLFNQDAVWVHQSFVGPSPQQTPVFDHGIFGCGQIAGIADTGQDYDLCYFWDNTNGAPPFSVCGLAPCPAATPATNRRKDIIYYNWSGGSPTGDDDTCPATFGASGHGTHTSGSIAGDMSPYADCSAFSSPNRNGGDGLAPGAKLVVQEMGDGLDYLNSLGGTLWNLADVAFQSGARIHSDSWGEACYDLFGDCDPSCQMPYDSFARDADLAMWNHPDLLILIAAGNAGSICPPPQAVGSPAIAKSVVGVGSLGHGASAGNPSYFTSPGPVFDGRLKPTLAAQGEATVSAASDLNPSSYNCSSCSLDGTSMATPTVAGLAALVREYYAAGFYATGARQPTQGLQPSAALVKATLIDGAVPLGASAPSPDFTSGYGRALLDATLAFTGSSFKLRVDDHREGLVTGGLVTHAYDVVAGTPFRATLVWTDYPAALAAASARVNELKMEVIDPAGNTWVQTLDAVSGAPVQVANSIDHDTANVEERLVFNAPTAGRWVVRVKGVDVPYGPQPFALVVRGALTDCPAPAAPGPLTLTTPADRQVRVSWSAVPGAAAYNVYRSFGACPGGSWIPVATGVTGTSFLDTTVSGGVRYSYTVAAASDASAFCESARSPCSSIVPTGECLLAPSFRGITSASSAGVSSCTITLFWDPATVFCGSDVRYNIYRSPSGSFTPGPSNRIARCVIGTSFTDSVNLTYGAANYYIVRAEDATTGHGGACRGGNEEGNLVVASAVADGPPVLGTWTDDAGDAGSAKFVTGSHWTIASSGGNAGPKVYIVTTTGADGGLCSDLTSPVITLASPGTGPQLSFATKHDLEYDPFGEFGAEGSLGQVEIATGPAFSNWTRVILSPDYPAYVEFPFNNCPTTASLDTYFSGTDPTYRTYTGSLVDWAGGDVKIRFHFSSDYFYPSGSWWIDDVSVTKAYVPGPCTTIGAGPPPVPDGAAVPGVPLRASKSGGNVVVTWDAGHCPATAVNLYRGAIGHYSAFTSGNCNLPPTGSATLSLPSNTWFLVAATNGASTDGSWGRTLTGAERNYSGASVACPAITQHVTNNGCP